MFEAVLRGSSRQQRERLSDEDKAEVDRVIGLIEQTPWHDGRFKTYLATPPIILSAYNDGRWQVADRIADSHFIEIYSISKLRQDG